MKRPAFAGWWSDSLLLRPLFRSHAMRAGLIGTAALGLTGCADFWSTPAQTTQLASSDAMEQQIDTLELQRRMGWHVGTDEADLHLDDATQKDVLGGDTWRSLRAQLASVLQPSSPSLLPFYTPTLFQSLLSSSAFDLVDQLLPIFTNRMQLAFARSRVVLAELEAAGWPTDTAIIVDLPGPESVAVAAALGEHLDPVFGFGNWPHPAGVVPAHETLAAALYYSPTFERQRIARALDAPPLFVLDANRLAPYTDENDQFDNRYVARLPTVEAMRRLGIRHILYVNADGAPELDDLNEAFVELEQAGIEVRMLALAEIVQSSEAPTAEEMEQDPELWVAVGEGLASFWYWGGSPLTHCGFWHHLGWPSKQRIVPPPSNAFGMRGPGSSRYRPQMRQTVFTGAQVRASNGSTFAHRPTSFAHTAITTSRSTGHVVAFRSGSFGRSSGGFSS